MAPDVISWRQILLTLPAGLCAASLVHILGYPEYRFLILSTTSIALYLLALALLSFAATERSHDLLKMRTPKGETKTEISLIVTSTRINGILAGNYLLTLPLVYRGGNPIGSCLLRVVTFFYAFKLLDLTVARASKPPVLLHHGQEIAITSRTQRMKYIWLLLTEYRYRSFDIAVVERGRIQPASKTGTYIPPIITVLLVYLTPTAETLFLLIFSIIYLALEASHTILHPSCLYPLFWQPFTANSITTFWSVHWHQGARPFLYSLGYAPAKSAFSEMFGHEIGSAIGVVATFSLSGVWHGWAAAALVDDPWLMGVWLWAIFTGHGVACVVERLLAKRGVSGGIVQRLLTWLIAVGTVSMWIREALPRAKI